MKVKLCILCNERPATIPDRYRMGRLINRICKECHSARLRNDIKEIMRHKNKRTDSDSLHYDYII